MLSYPAKNVSKNLKFIKSSDRPEFELARLCALASLEKKAEDVKILEVSNLTSVADYFVVCSAPSERQVQAIAREVLSVLKDQNKSPLGVEGLEEGSWVLIDFGGVVFHCFLDTLRFYYDLEGLWSDASRIDFENKVEDGKNTNRNRGKRP